ncbi:MAG: hypothetical protein FWF91_01795 [Coriobacteriia bacterium]|nr:hypothetical protein [Coriobacteriia bacterium]
MTDLMILLFFIFALASLAVAIIAVLIANDAKKTAKRMRRDVRRYLISGELAPETPEETVTTDKEAAVEAPTPSKQMALDLSDAALSTTAMAASEDTPEVLSTSAPEADHPTPVVGAGPSGQFIEEADVDYVQKVIVNPGQETSSADTLKSLVGMSDFFTAPQVAPVSKE